VGVENMGLFIPKDLLEMSIVFDDTQTLERDIMDTKSIFFGPGEKRGVTGRNDNHLVAFVSHPYGFIENPLFLFTPSGPAGGVHYLIERSHGVRA
jgi:hypothetical protein